MSKTIVCVLFLLVTAHLRACSQPSIPAVKATEPPVIDADLSDPCWKQAPQISDFYYLATQTEAPEPTTAWICYDDRNIYVAFHCRDSQPDGIVAQQTKRDGDVTLDDWVAFTLDCYRDHQRFVWFKATPRGVQCELLQAGTASKIEWKGDWTAAATQIDDGYIVEMAVPFSMLQYDSSSTEIGICFVRRHARWQQEWRSPNTGPRNDPRRFYLWEGLTLPQVEVKPLILAYSLLGLGDGSSPSKLGLDVKHAFTPSLTGVLTVNPDFRNVEQQVDSVDFTYTERRLPDSRPFFQQGSYFLPESELFYSRRIRDIDIGGMMSGRIGGFGLGFLHARDFDRQDHTVVQIEREWPALARLEFSGVHSSTEDGANSVGQIYGSYRLRDKNDRRLQVIGRASASDSALSRGNRTEIRLSSTGPPKFLGWSVGYKTVDKGYDPYLGYVPETDLRAWAIQTDLRDSPREGDIRSWDLSLSGEFVDHLDGTLFYNSFALEADCQWRNGREVYVELLASHRPPYHDRVGYIGYYWNTRDIFRNGFAGLAVGRLAGGDYLSYRIGQAWNLSDRLNILISYERGRITHPSPEAYSADQLICTLAHDIDTERTLAGRLIARGGRTNAYLAYKQRVRAGLDAYLIFGDPNAESTRNTVLLKLIRPI